MEKNMITAWYKYNKALQSISQIMGGTKNIVGEFAEKLASLYYKSAQLTASHQSCDIIDRKGRRIQVKSRRLENIRATQLNVIRSWDFDLLLVILFSEEGDILKAIEITSEDAKKYAKFNKHQNGWIITTSTPFLESGEVKNITQQLRKLMAQ